MNMNEILRIAFGSLTIAFGGLVVYFGLQGDIIMMGSILSIALAFLSVFHVYNAKIERENKLKEEIRKKLTMIKWENDSNLELLKILDNRMDKLYPKKLMHKKLQQPRSLKYDLTPEEIEIILEGKVWIQKEHCLYNNAIQILEIGHHFTNEFIDTIKEYIKKLDDLNQQKDFIQSWIIQRGFRLNPDEMKNLQTRIIEADKISKKLKDIITKEIDKKVRNRVYK